MATGKYLDGGGLAHLWDKIKSYLTTWKTSNFGAGTYEISGTATVESLYTSFLGNGDNIALMNLKRELIVRTPYGVGMLIPNQENASYGGTTRVTNQSGYKIAVLCIAFNSTSSSPDDRLITYYTIENGSLWEFNCSFSALYIWKKVTS